MTDRVPASQAPWERRVHAALVHASDGAPPPSVDSPSPAAIWDAVVGELPPRQTQEVLDAALRSPAAYAELRLALALAAELSVVEQSDVLAPATKPPTHWSSRWAPVTLAVAAALIATIALRPGTRATAPMPGASYRDGETPVVRATVAHEARLPRDAFVLSWHAQDDARYTVTVSTDSAQLLLRRSGLSKPRLTVPAAALEDLPAGTRVLWRVEAVSRDGVQSRSPTFVVVVQ